MSDPENLSEDLPQDGRPLDALNILGFFPAPEESESDYRIRVAATELWSEDLKTKPLEHAGPGSALPFERRIARDELERLGRHARSSYGVLPGWVPAYYEDDGLPVLTGGMTVHIPAPQTGFLPFFQLKSLFRFRDKWLLYSASEIVSHEMCHVARSPLGSVRYEETIAYRTSESRFRRYLGGALVGSRDSQILLGCLAFMLLWDLYTALSRAAAWMGHLGKIPAVATVLYGLYRNMLIRGEIGRARGLLAVFFGATADEVLFRLSDDDIRFCSQCAPSDFPAWWESISGFRGRWLRLLYPISEVRAIGNP